MIASLMLLACCQKPSPPISPHYVAGEAWRAQGIWHYPQDSLEFDQTGIAAVYRNPPRLMIDGEAYDAAALTGSLQTVGLPAVANVTNLDNGLQLTIRINDRGPADPGRIIAVTPVVAKLLEFGAMGVARVRVELLVPESRAAAEAFPGGAGVPLDVGLAPTGVVRQDDLAPPAGIRQAVLAHAASVHATPMPAADPPSHLPATLRRMASRPGTLMIELGSFSRRDLAELQRARLGAVDSRVEASRNGRTTDFLVGLGPYDTIEDADAALARAIAAGAADARIVVK